MSVLFNIESLFAADMEATRANPVADFIQAAIKTAQHSKGLTREDIVEDVSQLLACYPKDLDFMFGRDATSLYDRSIDLPDYRLALSGVYLEAAE